MKIQQTAWWLERTDGRGDDIRRKEGLQGHKYLDQFVQQHKTKESNVTAEHCNVSDIL
jgi:hypothetical protein